METATNEQVQSAAMMLNNAGFNSANALQIRLDMRDEVANFQKYLLGLETIVDINQDGDAVERVIQQGERLVNDYGFQALMGWISFIMNKHTVMGNFLDENWYGDYMCDLHMDIWSDLVINRRKYGIDINMLQSIHNKFMMCSRLLLTRPIGDKERNGMNNTTKIVENTQTNNQSRGLFSSFMGGSGRK
jgi:hypothetical protein